MPNARRIEILAFPNVQVLDVTGPLQVFATANEYASAWGEARPYELRVVARAKRVETSAGLGLETHELTPLDRPLHSLVVAGGWGVYDACADAVLLDWVRRRAEGAERIASVCSGAFLIAAAGLLDGRRAVTHWGRCAELAARFPKVKVEPQPIFIQDGKVWTSAGVTAGIDLALALVEADLGRRMALSVARQLVVFLKRPGGQAQFSTALALQEGGERFDRLHAFIVENLSADLSLPTLAERANMSARSFSRRYREATGRTPARAVEEMRVEAARRYLEEGLRVGEVTRRCGFGSDETMRRSFLRVLGTNPRGYRERF